MLATLRIKNLALVEQGHVEFGPGLNVITGETGAGKSILLDALGLVLGERADKRLLRAGADAFGVEALFELSDTEAADAVLSEAGATTCEEGRLIVRRIVRASGGAQLLVNDAPVTAQTLKRLGDALVDLHGPHDHQSLLRPDFQLMLLDASGRHVGEREAYVRAWAARRATHARCEALREGPGERASEQMDLLRYRMEEIEKARISPEEAESIEQEHAVIGQAQHVLELGGGAVQALTEGEGAAFDAVATAQRALEELARIMPEAENWREEARQTAVRIQELSASVQQALERIEAEPGRLEWLEERLALYQRLKRKYAPTVQGLLEMLEKDRARLADLESREERLAEAERQLALDDQAVRKAGEALRAKRQAAASRLAKVVTAELRALGFKHGLFEVALTEAVPRATGLDEVEFGFAPNAGEPMQPLRAIASSGEISRVMLAVKVALAKHDRIPVLVFDEIDANVGGEIGCAVGRKLAEVARHRQVICVTHLPQVAVYGARHLAVAKRVSEGRTFTDVTPLEETERPEEIARMLGGKDATSVSLRHAREMLERARAETEAV